MQYQDFIKPIAGIEYFLCLIDYGGKDGMGADVAPEYTRADIVETVCTAMVRGHSIVHVRKFKGNDFVDVTHSIVQDAFEKVHGNPSPLSPADRQAAEWDRKRDMAESV